jgi:light-regulated signal transduction histidine kinase (bacteriophytochrome)
MHTTEMDPITVDVLHAAVHDLKGPANRLRLLAQLLGRDVGAFDEDARKLLGYVEDSAAAIGTVADGLRWYADICARPLCREAVDLNGALASATANLRAEIESAGVEISSSTLPVVQADPFLMTWVIQELLTNAIRFRGADSPWVHISAAADAAGGWFVSLSDNGAGIESGQEERIFRPFKKLSHGPGAGMGLTICRRIIEKHEGRIWVEPRTTGAEFRFFVSGARPGEGTRP